LKHAVYKSLGMTTHSSYIGMECMHDDEKRTLPPAELLEFQGPSSRLREEYGRMRRVNQNQWVPPPLG
jgi:hypothetical protein